jgi:hypothetical protein
MNFQGLRDATSQPLEDDGSTCFVSWTVHSLMMRKITNKMQ